MNLHLKRHKGEKKKAEGPHSLDPILKGVVSSTHFQSTYGQHTTTS